MIQSKNSLQILLRSDYLILIVSAISIKFISAIQTGVLTRSLDITNFGILITILAYVGFCVRFFDFGLPSATTYFSKIYLASIGKICSIIYTHLFGLLILIILFLIIYIINSNSKFFENIVSIISIPMLICILIYAWTSIGIGLFNTLLLSNEKYFIYIKFAIFIAVLNLITIFGAKLISFLKLDIVLYIYTVLNIMYILILIYITKKDIKNRTNYDFKKTDFYIHGFKSHYGVVAKLIGTSIEIPIIAIFYGFKGVAIYSVGIFFREFIIFSLSSYSQIINNTILNNKGQYNIFKDILYKQIWISISALLMLGISSELIIKIIYGEAFIESLLLSRVLLVCGFFNVLSSICWIGLQSLKEELSILKLTCISAFINPLLILMVKNYSDDILFVAYIATFSSIVTFFLSYRCVIKVYRKLIIKI
jgi:O-antigen/teichoic acid export membrane protein